MIDKTIGFIGTGLMGGTIVRALVKTGTVSSGKVMVYDIDEKKMQALKDELGIEYTLDCGKMASGSDVIFICVKPYQVKEVLENLKEVAGADTVFVSIAAGVSISAMKAVLGQHAKIVRTMPNTPASVGEGMTVASCEEPVSREELELVKQLLSSFGRVEILEERLMNEVVALTSSSPAYVFMFIEAMADAAVLSGIRYELAYSLAAQAVLGSAKMVLESGKHPAILRNQVCTPAGTTIEAVYSLEKTGFRASVMEAMNECTRKTREMLK